MAIGTIASGETGSSVRTKINAAFAILDAGVAVLGTNIFTGLQNITQGTANKGVIASTGYSLTGSGVISLVDLSGAWNTSGSPTGFKLNITNTASGDSALLMDLQIGGVSQFNVTKAGSVYGNRFIFASNGVQALDTDGSVIIAPAGASIISKGTHYFSSQIVIGNLDPANRTYLDAIATGIIQIGLLAATTPIAQMIKAHDVTTGTGASLTLSGGKGSVAGGALILGASATTGAPAAIMTLKASGHINVAGIPTSASGLASGDLWSNGGVLTVA